MQLVIDVNVVIAMLIKPVLPIEIFFREDIEIFAPELLFKELENNKEIVNKKSSLNDAEIKELFRILKKKITSIPEEEFIDHIDIAENYVQTLKMWYILL